MTHSKANGQVQRCGASCESGIGVNLVCYLKPDHNGDHRDRWKGRDGYVYTTFTDEQVEKFPPTERGQ